MILMLLIFFIVIFPIVIIALFIAIVFYKISLSKKQQKTFAFFAASHKLAFTPENTSQSYKGSLKGELSNTISGTDLNTNRVISMFQYIYTTGSGSDSRVYYRTVLALTIKETNVHLFINSKVNDTTEQVELKSSQRYTAESDFGKYFDIYSTENKQIESLSIFAPDAMSFVMAECGLYDIEIVNDTLYIYTYDLLDTLQELEDFYTLGNILAKVIDDNTPNKHNFKVASGQPSSSAVTSLKKTNNYFKYALVLLFPIIFIAPFKLHTILKYTQTSSGWIYIIFMLTFIISFCYKLYKDSVIKNNYTKDRLSYFNNNVKKS